MTESERLEAVEAAGEAYLDGIEESLDAGRSPVKGGKYKKRLQDGGLAQLFETGSMRDHITFQPHRTNGQITGIKLGVFDTAPQIDRLKASGHNKGDSASKTQRQFIPFPKGEFKSKIEAEAKGAVNDIREQGQEERQEIQRVQEGQVETSLI